MAVGSDLQAHVLANHPQKCAASRFYPALLRSALAGILRNKAETLVRVFSGTLPWVRSTTGIQYVVDFPFSFFLQAGSD